MLWFGWRSLECISGQINILTSMDFVKKKSVPTARNFRENKVLAFDFTPNALVYMERLECTSRQKNFLTVCFMEDM